MKNKNNNYGQLGDGSTKSMNTPYKAKERQTYTTDCS